MIDPEIKKLKNQIKLLKYRLTREEQKKERYMERPKSICFGGKKNLKHDIEAYRYKRRRRMLICGRRQGKYSNNLALQREAKEGDEKVSVEPRC